MALKWPHLGGSVFWTFFIWVPEIPFLIPPKCQFWALRPVIRGSTAPKQVAASKLSVFKKKKKMCGGELTTLLNSPAPPAAAAASGKG